MAFTNVARFACKTNFIGFFVLEPSERREKQQLYFNKCDSLQVKEREKKIPWTGIEPGSAILSQKQKQLFCFCKVSQGVLYIMLKRKKIFPCLSVCSGGCRASLETFHLSGVVSASLNAAGIEKGLKFISQGSVYISHSGVVHLLYWSFLSFISRPFGGVDQ